MNASINVVSNVSHKLRYRIIHICTHINIKPIQSNYGSHGSHERIGCAGLETKKRGTKMNRCPTCWILEGADSIASGCDIATCPATFEPDVVERQRIEAIRKAMSLCDYRSPRVKAVLARLADGEGTAVLAAEFHITKARVRQIRSQARRRSEGAGVKGWPPMAKNTATRLQR